MTDDIPATRREVALIWEGHQREHIQHDIAHGREHASTEKALDVAAELAKENKEAANEWRGAMDDRERNFVTRADLQGMDHRVELLEASEIRRAENEKLRLVAEAESKQRDQERARSQQWRVGLMVGVGATVISLFLNLVIRLLTT